MQITFMNSRDIIVKKCVHHIQAKSTYFDVDDLIAY